MIHALANNFQTTLAVALADAVGTTIKLTDDTGLPALPCYMTIYSDYYEWWPRDPGNANAEMEVVELTADLGSNQYTCARGIAGTAQDHGSGSIIGGFILAEHMAEVVAYAVNLSKASYSSTGDITDAAVHEVDCTSGAVTLTLDKTYIQTGRVITVLKSDSTANAVTIDGDGANVNGESTQELIAQYDAVRLYWDGTEWWVI